MTLTRGALSYGLCCLLVALTMALGGVADPALLLIGAAAASVVIWPAMLLVARIAWGNQKTH